MRNKVKKMGVSRSSLRFRIEPCQLSLLVSIIFFFFSTTSAARAAAASSSSTSTSSGCINNNNNNNNGSMIQEQQQGNYCMEENNDYNLELLSIMPVDRSSSRMLLNPADPLTGNAVNSKAVAIDNCNRNPYKSCGTLPSSPKHPEHCGGIYRPPRDCP